MSWAGFNVAVCALRFFYGVTLGRSAMVERIPYARKRRQLPVILSADEVMQFLAAVPNLKHRTALMTAYAAGLRVSEVVRLRIADIDSGRMLIRVEQGKGADRHSGADGEDAGKGDVEVGNDAQRRRLEEASVVHRR